ncbi:MAG: Sir2 family NAD-dependent protein deacetylase [Pedobacter sp.]
MKNIVILTGSGISVESGLETFRGVDSLWEGYNLLDVATLDGWKRNPGLVQEFYNLQRGKVLKAVPNLAHLALVHLERAFNVHIITQNVDDLHERAGSKNVLHLHGEITKAQSDVDPSLTYNIIGSEITSNDKCIHGMSLRPNVVWFGESVSNMNYAISLCSSADIFAVVGTSLMVMPAASLVDEVPLYAQKFIIDPDPSIDYFNSIKINKTASLGVEELVKYLVK